jgi:hypothetical protein
VTAPETPSWAGDLELLGVPAFGKTWDIHVRDGKPEIEPPLS